MIGGKIWGTTECLIREPLFESHRLVIKPNYQCSLHVHARKGNAFLVTKGRLFIDVFKGGYVDPNAPPDTTELVANGRMTTVPPGEWHRFRTGDEPCEAVEFYYPGALSDDIQRKDHGGPIHPRKARGSVRKRSRR